MECTKNILLASAICFASLPCSAEQSALLNDSVFDRVSKETGVDSLLLYSIAVAESSTGVGNGNIAPTSLVIRTPEGAQFFPTIEAAKAGLKAALAITDLIDVGIMQINLHHHPQKDPYSLFDTYTNVSYGAKYLKAMMATTNDRIIGVGRYHNRDPDLALWYGSYVWKIRDNIAAIQ